MNSVGEQAPKPAVRGPVDCERADDEPADRERAGCERVGCEREFFDARAETRLERRLGNQDDPFQAPFEAAILEPLGDLGGRRVLDLGCGTGDLSYRLAEAGAEVTAVDVSPVSIEVAEQRFAAAGLAGRVKFLVGNADRLDLPDSSFDIIAGKWILHHVQLETAMPELRRVLRVGGRGVFVETSGLNPVLAASRRYLTGRLGVRRYGTLDERPITRADLEIIRANFPSTAVDHPNFVLFYLLSRNVLNHRAPRFNSLTRRIDNRVGSNSGRFGALSYYMRIQLRR